VREISPANLLMLNGPLEPIYAASLALGEGQLLSAIARKFRFVDPTTPLRR
jgi:hypothetical protein